MHVHHGMNGVARMEAPFEWQYHRYTTSVREDQNATDDIVGRNSYAPAHLILQRRLLADSTAQ